MNARTVHPRPPMALLAIGVFAALPLDARAAEAVLEWSRVVADAAAGPPALDARLAALTSLAVHDALNAIYRRHDACAIIPPARHGASPGAAVATATHDILVAVVPAQAERVEALYIACLARLRACPLAYPHCIADGIRTGHDAAAAILALRQDSGTDADALSAASSRSRSRRRDRRPLSPASP